jgi:hypothetical protein
MTGHQEARYQQTTQAAMAAEIELLLIRYSFDLAGYSPERWIDQWLNLYPALWLHEAVVEALYQGRYKAVSVWQILDLWQRRGKPLRHFSREFERMVAGRTLPLLFTSEIPSATPDLEVLQPESPPPDSAAPPLIMLPASRMGNQSQIPPYKPSQQFHLALPEKISLPPNQIWPANPPPIQQFVPTPETSDLYDKLKSIAQALILANAQIISTTLAERRVQPDAKLELKPEPEHSSEPSG